MCGINGFNWPDREMIEAMNDALKHRGPDGEGTYVDELVSIGHRRLAIIDLSERGRQPMCNEDNCIWLVCNGEIYNFRDLRKELERKGHLFKSDTDIEVIIHAYEEWQFECLNRFNGMFAFAIYDGPKKTLFLARDRFGIKPLYYYARGNKLIFSSEIKGILCHHLESKPNDSIVFDYLCLNLLQHRTETFFDGIYKLPPGHYLTYDWENQNISIKQWYKLQLRMTSTDERKRLEEVKSLFTDSVRLRMVADVPVGSCLSGGIDSSSIVCTMRQLLPEGNIKTFSSIFPGQEIDESDYVNEVTKFSKTDSSITSPCEEELLDELNDLIITQEEPFTGPSVYAQYRVMKLAHEKGMKVLLDGQGGDELFGGYIYYFGFYFYELFRKLSWYRLAKEMLFYLNNFRNLLPYQAFGFLLLPDLIKAKVWRKRVGWIRQELYEKFGSTGDTDPRWYAKSLSEGLLVTLCYSAIPHLLTWEDKNSMRWSIEARIPFLDYRFVETALSLPSEDKLRNGQTKYIFRRAVGESIPEIISQRTGKIGFGVPEEKWLRHPRVMEFTRDLVSSRSFKERIYWDHQQVTKQLELYLNSEESNERRARDIWKWLNLELWLRHFVN